jgi:hypothetical protein
MRVREDRHVDRFTALLPYLAVLACPLLMLVCLRGMRGMGTHASASQQDARQDPRQEPRQEAQPMAAAERIARLEREVADLRAELDARDTGQDRPCRRRPQPKPSRGS